MRALCHCALAVLTISAPAGAEDRSDHHGPQGIERVDFTEEMTELPELPSRYHCEELVSNGEADQAAFERCMRMEEVAYEELDRTFLDYSAQARTMCGNTVLGMNVGYMGLRYCLKRHD